MTIRSKDDVRTRQENSLLPLQIALAQNPNTYIPPRPSCSTDLNKRIVKKFDKDEINGLDN